MTKYIENLTNDLIGKNNYGGLLPRLRAAEFIKYTSLHLLNNDVKHMNSTTIGKIIFELQPDDTDIIFSKETFDSNIVIGDNLDDMVRQLVSLFLTFVILRRLNPSSPNSWINRTT